ncbi:MAG TPA: lysylphosphatidylglycerol synthase domain-containing protein [Gemmatimonadales bacterium]|nr:lysylphosphatidylglycerol synthase domain-containing protein [Gemmatimonadales bacterium]
MKPAVQLWLRRLLQVAGLGAALWYLVHTARTHRAELAAVPIALDPGLLLLASALTVLTWMLLVHSWTRSLRWWGESLPFGTGVRIWFVTNLSRFVPGAVWQFAHVSTEAIGARISPVAATGAILFQQLVLLGTGVALAASLAPVLPVSVTGTANPLAVLALASLGVVGVIILLPLAAPVLERWTTRLVRRQVAWPAPARRELTGYVGTLVLPWVAYGVAFWLFGRALLGDAAPGLLPAAAAFIGSYVAGIIAVIAPGGLGVREAALVLLLSPIAGTAPALLLAIASRLWLVALEILTALGVLLWHRAGVTRPE